MKNVHNAMRNTAATMIGPAQASRLVCFASGLVFLARGLVFVAGGLVLAGPAMPADSSLSSARYREAVNDAAAIYKADLLQCNRKSLDERIPCKREARAVRAKALDAAKARRALGADESADSSNSPNRETGSGLNASKTDIAPQLQRDSPPDIILPKK